MSRFTSDGSKTSPNFICIDKIVGFSKSRSHVRPTYPAARVYFIRVPGGRLQDITSPTSWSYISLPCRARAVYSCNSWVPTRPERNAKVHFVPDAVRPAWSSGAFRYSDGGVTRQVRRYRWAIKVLQAIPLVPQKCLTTTECAVFTVTIGALSFLAWLNRPYQLFNSIDVEA